MKNYMVVSWDCKGNFSTRLGSKGLQWLTTDRFVSSCFHSSSGFAAESMTWATTRYDQRGRTLLVMERLDANAL